MTRPSGLALLAPIAVAGLIAAHLLVFGFVTWRFAMTTAAVVAVLALALSLHLGLLARFANWMRRHRG